PTAFVLTLSLHDALPISHDGEEKPERLEHPEHGRRRHARIGLGVRQLLLEREERERGVERPREADGRAARVPGMEHVDRPPRERDRKSTRLNSSHLVISY